VSREFLPELQPRNFAENREYSGYIGVLPDGSYLAADVSRGTAYSV